MEILLSVKPTYAEKIFNGEKLYELRRIFTKKEISKVIVYESAPVSRVIGEFEIEEILHEPIKDLWNHTKDFSCVNKEFFYGYFKGKESGYAIKIKNSKKYINSKLLGEYGIKYPPQNYLLLKEK